MPTFGFTYIITMIGPTDSLDIIILAKLMDISNQLTEIFYIIHVNMQ